MAEKSYREIISSIKKGDLASVYILMGPEAYYIDLILNNIEKYAIPESDKDFNQSIFYGNDADMDYVVGAAQQLPVFADKKLVILKEAQTIPNNAKAQLEKLAPYVSKPNKNTIFVIAYKGDTLNATSKLIKAARQNDTIIFKSEEIKEYRLPSALKDYLASKKASADEKAIEMLCSSIGAPLSKLFGEVDKLLTIKGANARITAEDVEENIGFSKDFNNFELINALGAKDYPKAVRIVKYFEQNPKSNPTNVTTGNMITFYSNLVIAHYSADKSDSGIAQACGLKNQFAVKYIREGMKNYSPAKAVNAIHHLREFDTKSKGVGSLQNEYLLLKELIFKLFT